MKVDLTKAQIGAAIDALSNIVTCCSMTEQKQFFGTTQTAKAAARALNKLLKAYQRK